MDISLYFVDIVLVFVAVSSVLRGYRVGVFRLLLSSAGFILGLYAGMFIASFVSSHQQLSFSRTLLAFVIVIMSAFIVAGVGERLGLRLSNIAERLKLGKLNYFLGAGFELMFSLVLAWLVASTLSNVSSADIGRMIRSSRILTAMNHVLPTPPDFLARLETALNDSHFPKVFIGNEPSHAPVLSNETINTPAVLAASHSVVKVEGVGCGGVVEGSGFVSAPGYVVTNAHVIAGIRKPQVIINETHYSAVPVLFDANTDLAVLHVASLPTSPLTFEENARQPGSKAIAMGYPGGGPLTTSDGVVIDQIQAVGRNIYNQKVVSRSIYEVQADVEPGNSGGPLIDAEGKVAGVVFAKSVSDANVGYALTVQQVLTEVQQAQQRTGAVGVGQCVE